MRQAHVPERKCFSCKKRLKCHPSKSASCAWCGQITSPVGYKKTRRPWWRRAESEQTFVAAAESKTQHFLFTFILSPPFELKENPSNIQGLVFFPQASAWKRIKRQLPGGSGISVDRRDAKSRVRTSSFCMKRLRCLMKCETPLFVPNESRLERPGFAPTSI